MAYAIDTEVSVEKTESQIKAMLLKAGARRFMTMSDDDRAGIAFELNGKQLRFILPLPDPKHAQFARSPGGRRIYGPDERCRAWEQACRSRWRGLYINIKAKLEAVEIGITTFESEFLAHFVLANGQTVAEKVLPQLDEITTKPGSHLLLQ